MPLSGTNCLNLRKFVEENKFPIIRKLDNQYLDKIEKTRSIVAIAAINKKNVEHVAFLENFYYDIAIKRRDYIFTYLDIVEDKYMLQFFRLGNIDGIHIILYDFGNGKYYIDDNEIPDLESMESLINNIEQLKWTTGYFIEDLMNYFGIESSQNVLLTLFFGVISMMAIFCMICVCQIANWERKVK
jgi:hypothetical protein